MNIDGKPIDQCSDDEIRRALMALVSVIGALELAEVQALQFELLRRRRVADLMASDQSIERWFSSKTH